MKAIVYEKYGSSENLVLQEVEKPVPGDDEVLVKVNAVSINASDREFLTGTPVYTRFWGPFKPKFKILGSDIAGRIEAVGQNVTRFKPGDSVFGDILGHWGGFAEYACAPESSLILKPDDLTFEEAASLPQAAIVALQGIRDKGKVQPEKKVLINGAGGGAGSFAVQMAKLWGAEVTGVDNTEKLDLMRSIGADHVIDYRQEDFTRNDLHYDLILDLVAAHPLFAYRRALAPGGIYLLVGGSMSHILRAAFLGPLISLVGNKKLGMLVVKQNQGLNEVVELVQSGQIKPIIDKQYTLDEVPEAMRYFGAGLAKGKIAITMSE